MAIQIHASLITLLHEGDERVQAQVPVAQSGRAMPLSRRIGLRRYLAARSGPPIAALQVRPVPATRPTAMRFRGRCAQWRHCILSVAVEWATRTSVSRDASAVRAT